MNGNSTIIVCYNEAAGDMQCQRHNKSDYVKNNVFDKTAYFTDFPSRNVLAVFDTDDDMLYRDDGQKADFNVQSHRYGFKPDDYNKLFLNNQYVLYRFVGFLTKNRKYTCRLLRLSDNTYIKCSTRAVKNCIEFTETLPANVRRQHGVDW